MSERISGSATTTASGATSSSCSASPAAELARHPDTSARPVGLDGLDERSQRDADAGVPDDARRGRDRRAHRAGAAVGSPRAGVPRRPRRPGRRGRAADQERAATRLARHRAAEDHRHADRADRRRRHQESRPWSRASRASGASTPPRSATTSRGERRCSRRSTGSSTTGAARKSCSSSSTRRDVQARGQTPLGLLRATGAPQRPVGGKVDAAADRKASVLRVHAIHEDVKFTRTMAKAVQAELEDLTSGLGSVRSSRHRTEQSVGAFGADHQRTHSPGLPGSSWRGTT